MTAEEMFKELGFEGFKIIKFYDKELNQNE